MIRQVKTQEEMKAHLDGVFAHKIGDLLQYTALAHLVQNLIAGEIAPKYQWPVLVVTERHVLEAPEGIVNKWYLCRGFIVDEVNKHIGQIHGVKGPTSDLFHVLESEVEAYQVPGGSNVDTASR